MLFFLHQFLFGSFSNLVFNKIWVWVAASSNQIHYQTFTKIARQKMALGFKCFQPWQEN